jgi:hypothetical protein
MTITAFEAQASWVATVVGMPCSAVSTDGEQMVSLHFGEHSDTVEGDIEADRTITLEGAWRVEHGDEVIAGSVDPDEERVEALEELVGRQLERFEVSRPGYDLSLFLEDGYVVRCFPIDSIEHQPEVEDPDDVEVSWWVTGRGVPDDWETPREESGAGD